MIESLAIVAALFAGAGVVVRPRRRVGTGLVAAATVVWLAGCAGIAHGEFGHAGVVAGAAVLGVIAAAGVGVWTSTRPQWLMLGAVATATVRIPVPGTSGDVEEARLLMLLYGVIACMGAALAVGSWRTPNPVDRRASRLTCVADWGVAGWLVWAAAGTPFAVAPPEAAAQLLLGPIPFALLYAYLRATWPAVSARAGHWMLTAMAGVAGLAAVTGLIQWVTRDLFWNPKVIAANAVSPTFRVNAWLWDPNVYGLTVALGLLAAAVLLTRAPARRRPWIGWIGIAVLAGGLLVSWSLSSFLALAVAAGAGAGIVLRRGAALALLAAGIAGIGILLTPWGPTIADEPGRRALATEGLQMAADHPVAGVGYAGFEQEFADRALRRGERPGELRSSHTEFVTVAAETGAVGLLAHLAAGVGALLAAVVAVRARRQDAEWPPPSDAWWAAGGVVLITVHGAFYAGVTENPITWLVLAVAASSHAREREA